MSSNKNFMSKRKNLILDTLIDFELIYWFQNRSGVSEFGDSNNSTSKAVLFLFLLLFLVGWLWVSALESSRFVKVCLTKNKVSCSILSYNSQV